MKRLVVILTLCFLSFSGLFLAQLGGVFKSVRDPVAVLSTSEGPIRRLAREHLLWDRATAGMLLGRGDTIASGPDSRGTLELRKGGAIELEPSSLIILKDEPEAVRLDFIAGQDRPRWVKTPLHAASPAAIPSRLTARPRPPEESALGKAFVARQAELKKPATPLVAEGGLVTVASLPPIPQIPQPLDDAWIVDFDKVRDAELAWVGLPKFSYEVMLKGSSEYSAAKTVRTKLPRVSLSGVAEGRYLWTVRSVSPSGARSPASVPRWIEVRARRELGRPTIRKVLLEKRESHE
ncbi:MAG: hypothetical protein NDJ90_06975 [Oligoflexia bacterium]|nr:hypothetical protein [Oligoflexia bacterium]